MNYIYFLNICIVLSLAIWNTWCSSELHPVRLTYLIVYPVFPDSELPSTFCADFKFLYGFVQLNRHQRMLTSMELGGGRLSQHFYRFTFLLALSASNVITSGMEYIQYTSHYPTKKSLEVVLSFFSLSLWKYCHPSVYPCWYLNKKAEVDFSLLALDCVDSFSSFSHCQQFM